MGVTNNVKCVIFQVLIALCFCQRPVHAQYDARWVELPSSSYMPKLSSGVVYDPDRQSVFVVGGCVKYLLDGVSAVSTYYSSEAAEFTSGSWRQLGGLGSSFGQFRPRREVLSCYDPVNHRVVVGGGASDWDYHDTWVVSGGVATEIDDGSLPGGTGGKGMFFDTLRGSACYIEEKGRIYSLQGNLWTSLGTTSPGWGGTGQDRACFGYSFDPGNGKLVVFGGYANYPTPTLNGDTYVWTSASNSWTKPSPVQSPSARIYPAMVFDAQRGKHILFGGDHYGALSDVWEFDDALMTWTQLAIENPVSRSEHKMVYDSGSQRVLSVGGGTGYYWAPTGWVSTITELQFIKANHAATWTLSWFSGKWTADGVWESGQSGGTKPSPMIVPLGKPGTPAWLTAATNSRAAE